MGGRNGEPAGKIPDGRIQFIGTGRIEVTETDGDGILIFITLSQAVRAAGTTCPSAHTPHLLHPAANPHDRVVLGKTNLSPTHHKQQQV